MVDASLIGHEIDMLFEYNDEEGDAVNVWCQGKVASILSEIKMRWRLNVRGKDLVTVTIRHPKKSCLK